MSTALHLSRSLSRAHVSKGLIIRAIATQSTKTKAPQAIVQATNVAVKTLAASVVVDTPPRRSKELLRVRRHSAAAAAPTTPNEQQEVHSTVSEHEDLIVDMKALQALASQRPTPLRLKDMHYYANDPSQRLRNAQFLHKELPIRMAQRAMDLLTLPHGLSRHVQNVAHVYLKIIDSFQQMPPPTTPEQEDAFTDMLESVVLDRQSIPTLISQGICSWINSTQVTDDELQEMENALYRFFTARAGLRFLTEHHILSNPHRTHPQDLPEADFLGCIQTDCDPVHEIQQAVETVRQQTKECYGVCPPIQVVASGNTSGFTYVPHHLQYMLTELLKNSCRATVDTHFGEKEMPPIRVVVVQGAEDVTIKVADLGGGVSRSTMRDIWKFAHSSSSEQEANFDFGQDKLIGGKIRGFGLPLARIYARYFGGELTLRSMEGHGVDAYLYLPRLGYNCENLPASVVTSPGEGDSMPKQDLRSMAPIVQRSNTTTSGDKQQQEQDVLQQTAVV